MKSYGQINYEAMKLALGYTQRQATYYWEECMAKPEAWEASAQAVIEEYERRRLLAVPVEER